MIVSFQHHLALSEKIPSNIRSIDRIEIHTDNGKIENSQLIAVFGEISLDYTVLLTEKFEQNIDINENGYFRHIFTPKHKPNPLFAALDIPAFGQSF